MFIALCLYGGPVATLTPLGWSVLAAFSFPLLILVYCCFFFSSRRRHTRCLSDWSSDVCSSDLNAAQRAGQTERRTFVIVVTMAADQHADHQGHGQDRRREESGDEQRTDRQARSEERRVGKECRARWSAQRCTRK